MSLSAKYVKPVVYTVVTMFVLFMSYALFTEYVSEPFYRKGLSGVKYGAAGNGMCEKDYHFCTDKELEAFALQLQFKNLSQARRCFASAHLSYGNYKKMMLDYVAPVPSDPGLIDRILIKYGNLYCPDYNNER